MGEIADMMLDGTLCMQCGAAVLDENDEPLWECGYPRLCSDCERENAREVRSKKRRRHRRRSKAK